MRRPGIAPPPFASALSPEATAELGNLLPALARLLLPYLRAELEAERAADDRLPHTECILGARKTLQLIHAGKLPAEKVGKVYLLRRIDLDVFMRAHRVALPAPVAPVHADEDDDAVLDAAVRAELHLVKPVPAVAPRRRARSRR